MTDRGATLTLVLILAAVVVIGVFGSDSSISGSAVDVGSAGSGGKTTVGGTVVSVVDDTIRTEKTVNVDQNGDGKRDKAIIVKKSVNKEFYEQTYPIGSYVEFDNLAMWTGGDGKLNYYSITDETNKKITSNPSIVQIAPTGSVLVSGKES